MTLDQYKLCPCGSGKKIKFCCSRELIHELDRIDRMIQGDQRLAALEKIDSLLGKHPENPSLLTIEAEIEFQLEEFGKCRATLERVDRVSPRNANVAAMRSLIMAMEQQDLHAAIEHLQDAYEYAEKSIPTRVYDATLSLGMLLGFIGLPAASKGHCSLAMVLSDSKDERATQAMMRLNHSRDVPLMVREPFVLRGCPPNVTWRIEFEEAMKQLYQGRWRRAGQMLAAMSARILDAPAILYNLAMTQAWLGKNAEAIKALQQYARIREVPLDDRVEALALAQVLDPDPKKSMLDLVERSHALTQLDAAMEKLLSDDRFRRIAISQEMQSSAEGPLPRALFDASNKPFPRDPANVQVEDLVGRLGVVLLYGKETDRPARLVVQAPATLVNQLESLCAQVLGELFEPLIDEHVIDSVSWFDVEIMGNFAMPPGLSIDRQRQLSAEVACHAITQRWPIKPSPLLDGRTPTEAAADSHYKLVVLANLLNLELNFDSVHCPIDFNALRLQLNLPTRDPINANDVDLVRLPINRFTQLDFKSLTDEQLLIVYRRSYSVMFVQALRCAGLEVIERESLDDKVDKVEAYDVLSDVAPNTDEALEYLAKSRRLATAEGESPAAWLIDEMELRLLRNEMDKFSQLLKEIHSRYASEPGIMSSVAAVLSRYGLITPDGRFIMPVADNGDAAAAASPEAPGIWTPGGEAAGAEERAAPAKPESKIWIPGMD